MNIELGLKRISMAFWGFWALLGSFLFVIGILDGSKESWFVWAGLLIAMYAAHRVTCWIVSGFFAPR